jgi:hypothetical protein
MPDPRLVSRAQRAATLLERAWDRWRTVHGLVAEPLPPVSSYVGYSIEEPWGRPRVVFGVDAEDAERLAALLQESARSGPSAEMPAAGHSQPDNSGYPEHRVLGDVRARIPVQSRTSELLGALDQLNGTRPGQPDRGPGTERGTQAPAVESDVPADDSAGPGDGASPDAGLADGGLVDGGLVDGALGDGGPADGGPAARGVGSGPGLSVVADPPGDSAGNGQEPTEGSERSQDGPSATGPQDGGEPPTRPAPGASDPGDSGNGGRGVTDTMAAELAGWAAGELPGQAAARLASWATVGGMSARTSHEAGGTAESVI